MTVKPLAALLANVILVSSVLAASDSAGDGWIKLSDDLAAFRQPTGDWFIAGNARMDPENDKRLKGDLGEGVLINGPEGKTKNLVIRQQWGDVEVSLVFMIPRGSNSGVKLHGVYEIQIYDSWNKKDKLTGSDCGGIYPRADRIDGKYHYIDEGTAARECVQSAGRVANAGHQVCAPRFDADGNKTVNARFEKVVLNGKLIHDNAEVAHPTGDNWPNKEHAAGPLFFQADHGPVAFRNVRVRPL